MISIAMTTYNGEKYIHEQLNSIISQTEKEWELIICDDCSSDKTWEILKSFAKNDSRIKIYKNEINLGFKKNFEKVISLCNYEFIALSDQDDIWRNNHLEILLKNIGDNYLVCGNVELIDSNGNLQKNNHRNINRYISTDKNKQFLQVLHMNFVQGCACLFRKELVPKIIPIPDNQKYHDNWISLVASLENKPIIYINDVVLFYRRHENNVTIKIKKSPIDIALEKIKWNKDIEKYKISNDMLNIYKSVFNYTLHYTQRKIVVKDIYYFFRNYKLIYQTYNYSMILPRFIKRFILFY